MVPDAALVDRFRGDLDALIDPDVRLGLAVSGGPDVRIDQCVKIAAEAVNERGVRDHI